MIALEDWPREMKMRKKADPTDEKNVRARDEASEKGWGALGHRGFSRLERIIIASTNVS